MIKEKVWGETQGSEKETDNSQTETVNEVKDWKREENTDFDGGGEVREDVSESNTIERQEKDDTNSNGIYDPTVIEQNRRVLSQVKSEIRRGFKTDKDCKFCYERNIRRI